jgi:glycogen synthase
MKVLMFGWEFPPHISGGLGTACYGITKGLSKQGVEVLFVMPSASGDEDGSAAHIINASDVSFESTWTKVSDFFKNVKFLKVSSTLVPYVDPETFKNLTVQEMEERKKKSEYEMFRVKYGDKYKFSGKYGTNLMEEVARYAMVAASIASQNQFDVIHAHDWLLCRRNCCKKYFRQTTCGSRTCNGV